MKKAAIVRFIDNPKNYNNGEKELTNGKYYNALFTEYHGLFRNNLWIINDQDNFNYFYNLDDFQIIEDKDNVLSNNYAYVKCIKETFGLSLGKKYKALGKKDNDYLIYDDFMDSTLYNKAYFEIIEDTNKTLVNNELYNWQEFELNDLTAYKTEPVEVVCHCERKKRYANKN